MIYRLLPNRVRRSYLGGENIDRFTHAAADVSDGVPRPEDWTASVTHAFNGAEEIEGEGLGRTEEGFLISDLTGGKLPILVKLLDSAERLVIQAHPTVPFAKKYCNSDFGKTECWYFLSCADDACVYLGFREGVTRQAWEDAFYRGDSGAQLAMLHKVPVKAGDFVFVDGGVPHAIGGGCFMIELQEPSDLMVVAERVTPSGRVLPEKKLHMGLGYERMFDVYDYRGYSFDELKDRYCPRPRRLADGLYEIVGENLTEKFTMLRAENGASVKPGRRFAAVIAVSGEGHLGNTAVKAGDRLFIDTADGETFSVSGTDDLAVVICY